MAQVDGAYTLADRYLAQRGRVFMSGVQALARLPIDQLRADAEAGHHTAAFVSGYQGSPLGGLDQELARAAKLVPELPLVCRPAVNEELAATAVMGSQLASERPDRRYDGVLGIWYGKAPGLDRACDALRHAAFAGTSRLGGAVAIVGDDPAAKSSTLPSSSDATLVDLHMPILYPGDVQEVLDLGRHAVALSRLTGAWTAMKIVTAVADGTATVDVTGGRVVPVVPDLVPPGSRDGLPYVHHPDALLLAPRTLELERDFRVVRAELVRRYADANDLNALVVDPDDAWIGLVASGYTFHQLRAALGRLGLASSGDQERAGIRLLHMRMPIGFDPGVVRRFARGLTEIVVVEEKNPTLELLVKDALYDLADRPVVVGKRHPDGRVLMPETGLLDADVMLSGLRERLAVRLGDRLAPLPAPARERVRIPLSAGPEVARAPFFCSGCPHNRSTRVPDGSLVGAGIGCHTMVLLMDDERLGDVAGITAMGGEGAQWIGMAPFVETRHLVQNLGDGTYFHSGQLAIQAAVAAGVNITYKLLFNGTVAMTGGQDPVGGTDVAHVVRSLLAHGVRDVLVTTDDVDRYAGVDLGSGPDGPVLVWDRTRLEEAQRRLAATDGVTVLVHDQACAAHARQLRRRGVLPTPAGRVAVNHRICEGCGDCGVVSNCLSVQALDTPLGLKTTIDQDSCNLDRSCVDGDCPAFMTVTPADGRGRNGGGADVGRPLPRGPLPTPEPGPGSPGADVSAPDGPVTVRLAGVGGTGVVTTAQILGTAALLGGLEVTGLDQTGLSQKAGPVVSDLLLARGPAPASNAIGERGADVLLALDLLVASTHQVLGVADRARTRLVASTSWTPPGSMIGHPDRRPPTTGALVDAVADRVAPAPLLVDASGWCRALLGTAAPANLFVVGVALQAGLLPLTATDVERAIELNGVAVATNLAAFAWGRWWAVDPDLLGPEPGATSSPTDVIVAPLPSTLDRSVDAVVDSAGDDESLRAAVTLLAADLVGYQDERYARRFLDRLGTLAAAERAVDGADHQLVVTAAQCLHQLMAYKDEYEVARLLLAPEATEVATSVGGPGATVRWHLHPPVLAALGIGRKVAVPARLGTPVMRALAAGRRVRGRAVDPFGHTRVRQVERSMLAEYESALDLVAAALAADPSPARHAAAVALAALPTPVRGYERLKLERAATFREELAAARAAFT